MIFFMPAIANHADKAPNIRQAPDLTVLLVVDQLRASTVNSWYFLEKARVYEQASFDHACTETASGHATLLSGRTPAVHGIIGNTWHEAPLMSQQRAAADPQAKAVGGSGLAASPRQFRGEHLSLAWKLRYPESRFISISWKDRAATMLGGPGADVAFWTAESGFITSDYYTLSGKAALWLQEYNTHYPMNRYAGRQWLNGRHVVPTQTEDWSKALAYTPYSDEITLEFALYTVQKLNLGQGNRADFLSVSFSGMDYLAHKYSYPSAEARSQLYAVRSVVALLEARLKELLPGKRLLFVLSADHGGTIIEEQGKLYGVEYQRVSQQNFRNDVYTALNSRHPYIEKALIFRSPHFYLHYEAIGNPIFSRQEILQDAREVLRQRADVFAVIELSQEQGGVSPGQISLNPRESGRGKIPPHELATLVANCHFPGRSPDLYIVPQPWVYLQEGGGGIIAGHGSPFPDDRRVPLALWGDGIKAGREKQPVSIRQLAVTLGQLAGVPYRPKDGEQRVLPGFE